MCKNRFYLGLVARPKLNDRPRGKGGEHGGQQSQLGSSSAKATSEPPASRMRGGTRNIAEIVFQPDARTRR